MSQQNSYKYFSNFNCCYYPCHSNIDDLNCVFCFCPLFNYEDCGGNYTLLKNIIKDCSQCSLPHKADNYIYIIDFLKEKMK